MNAVDTNVLVRLYVQDDLEQFEKAKKLVEKASINNPIFVNQIVLVEWVWVLSDYYKVAKNNIVKELEIMLGTVDLVIEESAVVKKAIEHYKNSNADFADCLISEKNNEYSAAPTYTFDKKASKLKGMKLLK